MDSNECNSLKKLQPSRWMFALVIDWLIIVLSIWGACYFEQWALYILAWLIVGNRQHALTVLGHEGVHRLISRNQILNDALSNIFCFWPLTMSIHGYRRFHFQHHRFLKTDNDPEKILLEMDYFSLPVTAKTLTFRVIKDLLGLGVFDTSFVLDKMRASNFLDRALPFIFLFVVSAIFILLSLWEVPLIWIISMCTSQFAITRLRTWTEHTGISGTHKFSANNFILHAIYPHNIWIHQEHHDNPLIPFYNLPLARQKSPENTDGFASVYKKIFELSENKYSSNITETQSS